MAQYATDIQLGTRRGSRPLVWADTCNNRFGGSQSLVKIAQSIVGVSHGASIPSGGLVVLGLDQLTNAALARV
jgi:hypothetical protein